MESETFKKLKFRSIARLLIIGCALAWIGLWCLGAFVLVDELREYREFIVIPMIAIFVVFVICGLYLHNAECPNCGNRFSVRANGMYFNDFAGRCVNCGLRLNGTGGHDF
jgi:hypothetical protein